MLSDIVRKFWSNWELRFMVLSSLLLQFVLIKFGKQRKHKATSWLAFLVWSTYLLADWVATVSLSTLLNGQEESINELAVFWAPLLLLHLGGPDTITAYALEDNELWLRYLLGLFIQVGVAFYVYLRFQTSSALTFVAIPIFIAGIIKYGERIWILRSSSTRQVRNSVLSAPEPNPKELIEGNTPQQRMDLETYLCYKDSIPGARNLHEAFLSFKMFKPLFSDLTLRFYKELYGIFTLRPSKSSTDAFKLVETELGFLYDVLYTKTTILNCQLGAILRSICFLSTLSALVAFLFVISKHSHHKVDIAITCLLLVGAVFLDIYAVIAHVLSDWTLLGVTNHDNNLATFVYRTISSLSVLNKGKRQPRTMAQHSLISFCLKAKAVQYIRVEKMLDAYHILGKYWYTSWVNVEVGLKELIYSHILEKRKRYEFKNFDIDFLKDLLAKRGDDVLERRNILFEFSWCTKDIEFDHSILLWHVATDLCYLDDLRKTNGEDTFGSNCKMSRSLSHYMLYLLLMRPFMMPKGISEVRHRDTCVQAMRFFGKLDQPIEACQALLGLNFDSLPVFSELSRSKSVLLSGTWLAKQLQSLVTDDRWDPEEKWEMISEVWMEMLTYAASHCGWKEHCQQLRRGGELLTHVCLLMAHHGLSPKIRVVEFPVFLRDLSYRANWNWDHLDDMAYFLA